jgi:hypothetical protein
MKIIIDSEFILLRYLSNFKNETKNDRKMSVFNEFNYLVIQFVFNFGLIVVDSKNYFFYFYYLDHQLQRF